MNRKCTNFVRIYTTLTFSALSALSKLRYNPWVTLILSLFVEQNKQNFDNAGCLIDLHASVTFSSRWIRIWKFVSSHIVAPFVPRDKTAAYKIKPFAKLMLPLHERATIIVWIHMSFTSTSRRCNGFFSKFESVKVVFLPLRKSYFIRSLMVVCFGIYIFFHSRYKLTMIIISYSLW